MKKVFLSQFILGFLAQLFVDNANTKQNYFNLVAVSNYVISFFINDLYYTITFNEESLVIYVVNKKANDCSFDVLDISKLDLANSLLEAQNFVSKNIDYLPF